MRSGTGVNGVMASTGDGGALDGLRAALRDLVDTHGYKEVARRAGCSESTIVRILNGRTGNVGYVLAVEILALHDNLEERTAGD